MKAGTKLHMDGEWVNKMIDFKTLHFLPADELIEIIYKQQEEIDRFKTLYINVLTEYNCFLKDGDNND